MGGIRLKAVRKKPQKWSEDVIERRAFVDSPVNKQDVIHCTEAGPELLGLSIKRLVKTDIRIVEPMQIEASFEHRLMVKDGPQVIYPKRYKVESYFVFPPQMKVNKNTYPLESFYRDLKSYFNFRIPKLSYKEMMGLSDDSERSPLKKILFL